MKLMQLLWRQKQTLSIITSAFDFSNRAENALEKFHFSLEIITLLYNIIFDPFPSIFHFKIKAKLTENDRNSIIFSDGFSIWNLMPWWRVGQSGVDGLGGCCNFYISLLTTKGSRFCPFLVHFWSSRIYNKRVKFRLSQLE